MSEIILSDGRRCLISPEDADLAFDHSWTASKKGQILGRYNGKKVALSRVIGRRMRLDPDKQVDHIDRNKFNNQRPNLRSASNGQNRANSRCAQSSLTGLKGIKKRKNGRFGAIITVDGKKIWLGTFDTKEEAHEVYVTAAKTYFGDFACAG